MKIEAQYSDEAILHELGERLTRVRLDANLTQAELAEKAGVSQRTVARLESGLVATQLSGFVRVCRALGLVERFEMLVPESLPSPMAQLKMQGRRRQRASGRRAAGTVPRQWNWGTKS
ncbi:MAG: XRE family transcriptional regulator [Verrucomicrobia bacterium]|nr:XRE family transcriptional regulator [Verrucomicrobiota bacterium]